MSSHALYAYSTLSRDDFWSTNISTSVSNAFDVWTSHVQALSFMLVEEVVSLSLSHASFPDLIMENPHLLMPIVSDIDALA